MFLQSSSEELLIREGVARREELGDLPGASMARAEGLGYFVEMLRGNWAAAERELRNGYDALESMGDKNYLSTAAGWLAHCLYAQQRYEEAEQFAQICEEAAARSWIASQVLWRGVKGMLRARGGDVEEGEALARESVGLALQTDRIDIQADSLMDLAEVLRLSGRSGEAATVIEDALRRYEEKGIRSALPRTKRLLSELTAAGSRA